MKKIMEEFADVVLEIIYWIPIIFGFYQALKVVSV